MRPLAAASACCLLAGTAHAADIDVVAVDGALRPGGVGEILVAVADADGRPSTVRPDVRVQGGKAVPLETRTAPGVSAWTVTVPRDVDEVAVTVTSLGETRVVEIPVVSQQTSGLSVVATTGDVDDAVLWFSVVGEDVPPATSLQVVTSEGRVSRVEPTGAGLRVALDVEPGGFPRFVVVGVRDGRRDEAPQWASLRLADRLELPITTEPGSTFRVDAGGRQYGPELVGPTGKGSLTIDHLPDFTEAQITVRDPAGNEVTRSVALPGTPTVRLVPFVWSPRYPFESPPGVLLRGVRADGRPWAGAPPQCRMPGAGEVPVTRVGQGVWRMALPGDVPQDVWEVRVRCALGTAAEAAFQVPLAEGVPVSLSVKVFPEVLSTDLPIADLQVVLENASGARIDARGRFEATASAGTVSLDVRPGAAVRGEYRGDLSVEAPDDLVEVAWFPPAGEGSPDKVEVTSGPGAPGGHEVYVRVLNVLRHPLPGEVVELVADGRTLVGLTDGEGWATFQLPTTSARPVGRVQVRTGHRAWDALVVRGATSGWGPGAPDLVASQRVQVDPGRVAEIALEVTPRELRPGPAARAEVVASMLDRSGLPTRREEPLLRATEGTLVPLGQDRDGSWRWTWIPPSGFRARQVELTASDEALGLEDSVVVKVVPQSIRRWIGVSAGVQSNFGRLTAPHVAVDAAWRIQVGAADEERLRPGRSRVMIRVGAGWYGGSATVPVVGSVQGSLRMDLVPIWATIVLRQEYPAHAFWFSLGGMVVPFIGASTFDDRLVSRRGGVLPPGLLATAGYGLRVPGGELVFEIKGTVLTSTGSDISFDGQVGGLAGMLGYRVSY